MQFQIGHGYGQEWSQDTCVRHSNPETGSGGTVYGWQLVETIVVKQYPFMQSEREWWVSPMYKGSQSVHWS